MADRPLDRPLRLLQAGGSLAGWGGIERYVDNLEKGVSNLGIECAVCAPVGSPLWTSGTGKRFEVQTPPRNRLGALPAYRRAIKEFQPDIVHVHYSPDFSPAAMAARLMKVPLVVMTRHLGLPWFKPKAVSLAKMYDQIICVSDAVRQVLENSGVPRNRLAVVKTGMARLEPASEAAIKEMISSTAPERPRIVFVGRLIHEKGTSTLIKAVHSLPEADLHIFGTGPDENRLRGIVDSLGIQSRCILHGQVQDVSNAMAFADVIVVPSEWYEAFPTVVIEAMSIGAPVIASRTGGIPEIIDHEKTGILFQTGNASELSSWLKKLISDPKLRSGLGNAGLEKYEQEFTLEKMGVRFKDFYEGQLTRKGAARR